MANKRVARKIRKESTVNVIREVIKETVRDVTPQEALDVLVKHLMVHSPASCYFIDTHGIDDMSLYRKWYVHTASTIGDYQLTSNVKRK